MNIPIQLDGHLIGEAQFEPEQLAIINNARIVVVGEKLISIITAEREPKPQNYNGRWSTGEEDVIVTITRIPIKRPV